MVIIKPDELKKGLKQELFTVAIRRHQEDAARFNKNMRYYENKADILERKRLSDIPNNRISYPYANYVANLSAGYLLGEPVTYHGEEGDKGLEKLIELYNKQMIAVEDMNAALYQAIFGRAMMLVYIDKEGEPVTATVDPRICFIACDSTVQKNPLFGVYMHTDNIHGAYTVYTKEEIIEVDGGRGYGKINSVKVNPFNRIPIIEVKNNKSDTGDYEKIISLIDAYNIVGSDRVNDREQFSNAMLVLRGVSGLGEDEDSEIEEVQRMREQKILALPDAEASAEWLTKPNEGKDVELLRGSLEEDIHKLSQTPNFNDESFGGNASGVAIRYKLFNFDNRILLKETYMRKSLQERAEVYGEWMRKTLGLTLDFTSVTIRFSRRLPVDELDRARALKTLEGIATEEAIKDNIPFNEDNNS